MYAHVNYCGFTKITKKHDRMTGYVTQKKFIQKKVNITKFSSFTLYNRSILIYYLDYGILFVLLKINILFFHVVYHTLKLFHQWKILKKWKKWTNPLMKLIKRLNCLFSSFLICLFYILFDVLLFCFIMRFIILLCITVFFTVNCCDNIRDCYTEEEALSYVNQLTDNFKDLSISLIKTVIVCSVYNIIEYWAFLVESCFQGY